MRIKYLKCLFFLCMGVFAPGCNAKHVHKRGVMDNVNDGLKMAGQMFGINTAADVANLVAKAFSATTTPTTSTRRKPDILSFIIQQVLKDPSPKTSKDESQNSKDNSEESNTKTPPPAAASAETNDSFGLNINAATIVKTMLRMVGFDASKLGALAINALIMVASAIGNAILGNTKPPTRDSNLSSPEPETDESDSEQQHYSSTEHHQARQLRDGTPLDWYLQSPSPRMQNLLNDAMDRSLTDRVTEMIAGREEKEGQGACLKMLVCKSAPFIWGMQKSIKKRIDGQSEGEEKEKATEENVQNTKIFNPDALFTDLPSLADFREHSKKCELLYSTHCNVTKSYERHRQKRSANGDENLC